MLNALLTAVEWICSKHNIRIQCLKVLTIIVSKMYAYIPIKYVLLINYESIILGFIMYRKISIIKNINDDLRPVYVKFKLCRYSNFFEEWYSIILFIVG